MDPSRVKNRKSHIARQLAQSLRNRHAELRSGPALRLRSRRRFHARRHRVKHSLSELLDASRFAARVFELRLQQLMLEGFVIHFVGTITRRLYGSLKLSRI